jgi:hypothetical protein
MCRRSTSWPRPRPVAVGALGLITDPNEGERIVREGLAIW